VVRNAAAGFQVAVVERDGIVGEVDQRRLAAGVAHRLRGGARQALVERRRARAAGEDENLGVHVQAFGRNRREGAAHSAFAPEALTTLPRRSVSRAMKAPNSSGVPPTTVPPMSPIFWATSGLR